MASQYLATYAENAHFVAPKRIAHEASGEGGESNVLQLATAFRQHGVCELLRTGSPRAFFVGTMQSAGAYLHFARRDGGATAILSHAKPFLDAVAGGYGRAAVTIAELCAPWLWAPDREYQEDALYLKTLMAMARGLAPEGLVTQVAAYDAALGDASDPRLSVLEAFVEADAEALRAGLADLGRARDERIDASVEQGVLTDEAEAWLRPFHLEAAALLRLADARGIATERHHPGVPEAIRRAPPFRFDDRAWERVPYAPAP